MMKAAETLLGVLCNGEASRRKSILRLELKYVCQGLVEQIGVTFDGKYVT